MIARQMALVFVLSRILHGAVPTYSQDVAPILRQHCVSCHRANDIAPMAFETYQQTRPWAAAIREAVVTHEMPPWHGDPQSHAFSNDTRLSEAEIAILTSWATNGAREGEPAASSVGKALPAGWHISPDAVLSLPEEQQVPAGAQDAYEYIHVPTHFAEDKWVQVAEVLPGNRQIVHHATVSVWETEPDAKSDDARPKVEYRLLTGKVHHIRPEVPVVDDGCTYQTGGDWPDNMVRPGIFVAIYLPGHIPEVRPAGYAIRIPKDATLEFQIHYSNRTGRAQFDRTSIGLLWAKTPVSHPL